MEEQAEQAWANRSVYVIGGGTRVEKNRKRMSVRSKWSVRRGGGGLER